MEKIEINKFRLKKSSKDLAWPLNIYFIVLSYSILRKRFSVYYIFKQSNLSFIYVVVSYFILNLDIYVQRIQNKGVLQKRKGKLCSWGSLSSSPPFFFFKYSFQGLARSFQKRDLSVLGIYNSLLLSPGFREPCAFAAGSLLFRVQQYPVQS